MVFYILVRNFDLIMFLQTRQNDKCKRLFAKTDCITLIWYTIMSPTESSSNKRPNFWASKSTKSLCKSTVHLIIAIKQIRINKILALALFIQSELVNRLAYLPIDFTGSGYRCGVKVFLKAISVIEQISALYSSILALKIYWVNLAFRQIWNYTNAITL